MHPLNDEMYWCTFSRFSDNSEPNMDFYEQALPKTFFCSSYQGWWSCQRFLQFWDRRQSPQRYTTQIQANQLNLIAAMHNELDDDQPNYYSPWFLELNFKNYHHKGKWPKSIAKFDNKLIHQLLNLFKNTAHNSSDNFFVF